ncbi:hypothetical protein [Streptomyces sp. NPDC054940]
MSRTEELRAAAELLAEDRDAVQAIYEGLHGALCRTETAACAFAAPIFRDAIRAGLLRAQRIGEA